MHVTFTEAIEIDKGGEKYITHAGEQIDILDFTKEELMQFNGKELESIIETFSFETGTEKQLHYYVDIKKLLTGSDEELSQKHLEAIRPEGERDELVEISILMAIKLKTLDALIIISEDVKKHGNKMLDDACEILKNSLNDSIAGLEDAFQSELDKLKAFYKDLDVGSRQIKIADISLEVF